jgi:two-component system, chemotaxis family, CheB/CheR fusion protein
MNVHHIDDPQTYLSFLRENLHEIDALMEELLISVTSFFRDPAAWKALADEALPRLIQERPDGHSLRVWAPGCATGEEAYSVAIVLQEQIRKAERTHSVQIFATDLDERAIDVARSGIYPEGISADVSSERLKAFFSREDGAYRIHKSIRDSIVFAPQNVISDPPFTRLDLIVCRNVLIYLDIGAQQTVLPNFHYALLPGGLLFLGSAESLGEAGELFDVINAKHKILRRKEVAKPAHPILPGGTRRRSAAGALGRKMAPQGLSSNSAGGLSSSCWIGSSHAASWWTTGARWCMFRGAAACTWSLSKARPETTCWKWPGRGWRRPWRLLCVRPGRNSGRSSVQTSACGPTAGIRTWT